MVQLRRVDAKERQARLLALLAETGPRPAPELRHALADVTSTHFVDVTLKELLAAKGITAAKVTLRTPARWGSETLVTYPATVYDVTKPRIRARRKIEWPLRPEWKTEALGLAVRSRDESSQLNGVPEATYEALRAT